MVNRARTARRAVHVAGLCAAWSGTAFAGNNFEADLYGDVGLSATDHNGGELAFVIGGLDFFARTKLPKGSLLVTEVLLEFIDDEPVVDTERLYVQIPLWRQALEVRAGRSHTPIGLYNDIYHHGKYFQAGTTRPLLLGFEDEGGLLPAHMNGAGLLGRLATDGGTTLRYELLTGNGRSHHASDVLDTVDPNLFKAVCGRIILSPGALPPLAFGGSVYIDEIPPDDPTGAHGGRNEGLDEQIFNGFVRVSGPVGQVLVEAFHVSHEPISGGERTGVRGGFVQADGRWGDFGPYARAELHEHDAADPFFEHHMVASHSKDGTIGLRYWPEEAIVIKAEYVRSFATMSKGNSANLQFAFRF